MLALEHAVKAAFASFGAAIGVAIVIVGIALLRRATVVSLALLGSVIGAIVFLVQRGPAHDASLYAAGGSLAGMLLGAAVGMTVRPPQQDAAGYRRAGVAVAGAALPAAVALMFFLDGWLCPMYVVRPTETCNYCFEGKGFGLPEDIAIVLLIEFLLLAGVLAFCAWLAAVPGVDEHASSVGGHRG